MAGIVSAIRNDNYNGFYFAKEWVNGPGTGKESSDARNAEIAAGAPVGPGASPHFNFSPLDASGKEIQTGDPRHAQVNGGAPYIGLRVKVGGQQYELRSPNGGEAGPFTFHQMDANFGCTPNFKVDAGFKGTATVEVQAFLLTDESIAGPWATPINVQG